MDAGSPKAAFTTRRELQAYLHPAATYFASILVKTYKVCLLRLLPAMPRWSIDLPQLPDLNRSSRCHWVLREVLPPCDWTQRHSENALRRLNIIADTRRVFGSPAGAVPRAPAALIIDDLHWIDTAGERRRQDTTRRYWAAGRRMHLADRIR